jgi:glycosyltransferase involved in cell wall biosynthesis
LAKLNNDHNYVLFVQSPSKRLFADAADRIEVVEPPVTLTDSHARIFLEQLWLPAQAKRLSVTVMHYTGTAASFLVRRSDVITIHHDSITQRRSMSATRNLYYDTVFRFARRAGFIITPTAAYASELVQHYGYSTARLRPVHHGTLDVFRPASPEVVEQTRERWHIEPGAILAVTNSLPHKNLPRLMESFDRLRTHYGLDRQLVLVGNVNPAVIESCTQKNPALRARIRLIPFVPHEELPGLYGAADVFVFVSLTETFGMPLTEAMSCGVPIVASSLPVLVEVLQDAARMVDPTDPCHIAKGIYDLMTDEILRNALRDRALRRAKRFCWERTAQQTASIYDEALTT